MAALDLMESSWSRFSRWYLQCQRGGAVCSRCWNRYAIISGCHAWMDGWMLRRLWGEAGHVGGWGPEPLDVRRMYFDPLLVEEETATDGNKALGACLDMTISRETSTQGVLIHVTRTTAIPQTLPVQDTGGALLLTGEFVISFLHARISINRVLEDNAAHPMPKDRVTHSTLQNILWCCPWPPYQSLGRTSK